MPEKDKKLEGFNRRSFLKATLATAAGIKLSSSGIDLGQIALQASKTANSVVPLSIPASVAGEYASAAKNAYEEICGVNMLSSSLMKFNQEGIAKIDAMRAKAGMRSFSEEPARKKITEEALVESINNSFECFLDATDWCQQRNSITKNDNEFQKLYTYIEAMRHEEVKEEILITAKLIQYHAELHGFALPEGTEQALKALADDNFRRCSPQELGKIYRVFNRYENDDEKLTQRIVDAVTDINDRYYARYYDKAGLDPDDVSYIFEHLYKGNNSWTYSIELRFKDEFAELHSAFFDMNSPTLETDLQKAIVTYARQATGYSLSSFDHLFTTTPEKIEKNDAKAIEKQHIEKPEDSIAARIKMRSAFSKDDYRSM
jgi:hypothetical protein